MPRGVALDVLDSVLAHRKPLDDTLEAHPDFARLETRDRAFARILVATTLRRLGQIDGLIDHCLARPLPAKATVPRDALRLGAAQLVFLGTPAHAAVDTTVTLARRRGCGPHAALINAVLRRLSREGHRIADVQDAPRLNTPDWLWRSWRSAYGEASARQIATVHLAEPPLDLTPRRDASAVAAAVGGTVLPTGSVRLEAKGSISSLPGFAGGDWWVQDAGAALPARLFGDVAGRRVIDLCAAPGGKTAQLAAAGADVVAVDQSARRLDRLKENLDRLRLRAEIAVADMASWRPSAPADAVLLDAPCTATGTIRRHPDVARLKRPRDVSDLAETQARLLAAAIEIVRPGGTLVYCVCSLEPEEGEQQIDTMIATGRVRRSPISVTDVGGLVELVSSKGDLRSLPCHLAGAGGIDGFYAARLVRA